MLSQDRREMIAVAALQQHTHNVVGNLLLRVR